MARSAVLIVLGLFLLTPTFSANVYFNNNLLSQCSPSCDVTPDFWVGGNPPAPGDDVRFDFSGIDFSTQRDLELVINNMTKIGSLEIFADSPSSISGLRRVTIKMTHPDSGVFEIGHTRVTGTPVILLFHETTLIGDSLTVNQTELRTESADLKLNTLDSLSSTLNLTSSLEANSSISFTKGDLSLSSLYLKCPQVTIRNASIDIAITAHAESTISIVNSIGNFVLSPDWTPQNGPVVNVNESLIFSGSKISSVFLGRTFLYQSFYHINHHSVAEGSVTVSANSLLEFIFLQPNEIELSNVSITLEPGSMLGFNNFTTTSNMLAFSKSSVNLGGARFFLSFSTSIVNVPQVTIIHNVQRSSSIDGRFAILDGPVFDESYVQASAVRSMIPPELSYEYGDFGVRLMVTWARWNAIVGGSILGGALALTLVIVGVIYIVLKCQKRSEYEVIGTDPEASRIQRV